MTQNMKFKDRQNGKNKASTKNSWMQKQEKQIPKTKKQKHRKDDFYNETA